jgi:hypothetical protein
MLSFEFHNPTLNMRRSLQLHVYCFSIPCEPTSASPQAADVRAAIAEVWVVDKSISAAEIKARSHLLDYAWIPTSVQHALEPTPEQIARLDESSQALRRKALRQGVASLFVAWPKIEGREDDPIEVRSFEVPLKPTDREQ